jgi:hypothetical protein
VVLVLPYEADAAAAKPGRLCEALLFEHDIVSPLGAGSWEAAQ